jgi:hypothetical protein
MFNIVFFSFMLNLFIDFVEVKYLYSYLYSITSEIIIVSKTSTHLNLKIIKLELKKKYSNTQVLLTNY